MKTLRQHRRERFISQQTLATESGVRIETLSDNRTVRLGLPPRSVQGNGSSPLPCPDEGNKLSNIRPEKEVTLCALRGHLRRSRAIRAEVFGPAPEINPDTDNGEVEK